MPSLRPLWMCCQGTGIRALSWGTSTCSCTAPMRSISPGAAGTTAIPAASRRRTERGLRGARWRKVDMTGEVSGGFRWFWCPKDAIKDNFRTIGCKYKWMRCVSNPRNFSSGPLPSSPPETEARRLQNLHQRAAFVWWHEVHHQGTLQVVRHILPVAKAHHLVGLRLLGQYMGVSWIGSPNGWLIRENPI